MSSATTIRVTTTTTTTTTTADVTTTTATTTTPDVTTNNTLTTQNATVYTAKPPVDHTTVTIVASVVPAVLCLLLCFAIAVYVKRKKSRPKKSLPSLSVCNLRYSSYNDEASSSHTFDESKNSYQDSEVYENTKTTNGQRKPPVAIKPKPSPMMPTPKSKLSPMVPKSKSSPMMPKSKSSPMMPKSKPSPMMPKPPYRPKQDAVAATSPDIPCYIDILPDPMTPDVGEQYSYVPTQFAAPNLSMPHRQSSENPSEASEEYYNVPIGSRYQNVGVKLK